MRAAKTNSHSKSKKSRVLATDRGRAKPKTKSKSKISIKAKTARVTAAAKKSAAKRVLAQDAKARGHMVSHKSAQPHTAVLPTSHPHKNNSGGTSPSAGFKRDIFDVRKPNLPEWDDEYEFSADEADDLDDDEENAIEANGMATSDGLQAEGEPREDNRHLNSSSHQMGRKQGPRFKGRAGSARHY